MLKLQHLEGNAFYSERYVEKDINCFPILELASGERRGDNSWWLKIISQMARQQLKSYSCPCGNRGWVELAECQCRSVCVCRCLTCDSPYVRWNYRAISAELQHWGLLSVMWEGRLPPIGTELLAAAFLPLLSGGWRGITCQHAGSHCFGAGTNAASIRQLDCGRVHRVRLNPSYVYDYTWLFFTGMCTERPWPVIVRMCACERLYSRGAKLNRLCVAISLFIASTMTPKLKLSLATQSVIVMPITSNCWQQHPCQDVWRDCVQGSRTHKGSGKKTSKLP